VIGAVPAQDPGLDAAVQDPSVPDQDPSLRDQDLDQNPRIPENPKGPAQDPKKQILRRQRGQDLNPTDLGPNLKDPGQSPTDPDQSPTNPDQNLTSLGLNLARDPGLDLVSGLKRTESRTKRNHAQDPDLNLVIGQIKHAMEMIRNDPGLLVEEVRNESDAILF